jgi:CheY-like chemotaxis protein
MTSPESARPLRPPRASSEARVDAPKAQVRPPLERGAAERQRLYAELFESHQERQRAPLQVLLEKIGRLAEGVLAPAEREAAYEAPDSGSALLQAIETCLAELGAAQDEERVAQLAGESGSLRSSEGCASFALGLVHAARGSALTLAQADVCAPGPPARVLVVDGDPVAQRVTLGFLASEGYAGTGVDSGKLALQRVVEEEFDAVLLDLALPGMDGHQVALAIRAAEGECPARRLPLIALTTALDPELRHACLLSGMDAVLGKPVRPGELDGLLRAWLPSGPRPA